MKNPPSKKTITQLREGVEHKLGFDITCTRDCEVLSMEIERFDRRFSLSVSTLRRFFGLIQKKSEYSLSTLNSLSRFIGFKSYKNWEELKEQSKGSDVIIQNNSKSDSGSIAETIATLDAMIETLIRNPSFRLSAAQLKSTKESATQLFRLQAMPEWLWMKTNRHPLARKLVESYPPLDYLSKFGLDLMTDFLSTANKPEDRMFAMGLILLSELYQGKETAETHKRIPTVLELSTSIHPMPQARILGLNLLAISEGIYTETNQSDHFRTIIYEGINNELKIWPRWSTATCPFINKFVEWAILANSSEFCNEVIDGIIGYRTRQDFSTRRFLLDNVLDLRLAWCYYITGRELEASVLVDSISQDRFPEHEERTLLIWYHTLIQKIGSPKRKKSSLISLDLLTSQTNYTGLYRRLYNLKPNQPEINMVKVVPSIKE
jgi:hypothetical protein|tara:strand:- start:653 stop:1954 length:1302 start_codon:yes stop_codon:yes gene_type:complete